MTRYGIPEGRPSVMSLPTIRVVEGSAGAADDLLSLMYMSIVFSF